METTRIDQTQRPYLAVLDAANARAVHAPDGPEARGLGLANLKQTLRDGVVPARRRQDLLQFLQARGQATIKELAGWLGVSEATVRRDLDQLAGQELLTRTYGGAITPDGASSGASFQDRPHTPEGAIARAACRLVGRGETLLVSAGAAFWPVASGLVQKGLTVITNDLRLPAALPPHVEAYVLGGKYVRDAQATAAPLAVSGIEVRVDSALIRVDGVAVEHGLTTARLEDAWLISTMMDAARRTIVMARGAALGKTSLGRLGALDRMQALVTDETPPAGLSQALNRARVKVIVAAPA
jgi:DeoR family transcriptional regulator, fructose operon transcriptional repressor